MHDQAYQQLQIASYDPRWVAEFGSERERIAQALGNLARRIDHNGSTAVPGLDAKPIIDIQFSVTLPLAKHMRMRRPSHRARRSDRTRPRLTSIRYAKLGAG